MIGVKTIDHTNPTAKRSFNCLLIIPTATEQNMYKMHMMIRLTVLIESDSSSNMSFKLYRLCLIVLQCCPCYQGINNYKKHKH